MSETTEKDAVLAENPLSEREMEVAQLLVTGASNAEIARDLVISPHTVKVHLRNIFEKLHVNSRTEASMLLVQHGWVVVPGLELAPAEATPAEPQMPEPKPLPDLPVRVAPWQRLYLLGAFLLSLTFVAVPNLVSLAQAPADLLSDANRTPAAPVALRLEPRWEMRTPLKQPLSRLGMAALDNRLYVMGGELASGEVVADAAVYDLQTNAWSQIAALPLPLANLAAVAQQDKIYVAGGSTSGDQPGASPVLVDSLLEYDPATNRWRTLSSLPYPVAGAALAAGDQALYLVGGWDGREMRDEIWSYALAPGTSAPSWQLLGHLSKARAFLGATSVGGELYIAGGYDGQRELDLAEVFTPANGERRQLPPLGTPRGGLALVYDGLALYALGGGWTHSIATHERFDLATNAWSNFPSPVQGEWRNLAAAAIGGRLHLAGGWGGVYLDHHLQYQSSFRTLLPVISND